MMTIQNYQTGTDAELIEASRAGDMNALFQLIEKYRKQLYGVIGNKIMLKKYIKYVNEDLLEYWHSKFYDFMTVLTKIKGKSKLENINPDKVSSWLCKCCENFLKDNDEFNSLDIYDNFNLKKLSEIPDLDNPNPTDFTKTQLKQFIMIIETVDKTFTNFEKYIVLTDLYVKKRHPDMVLYLDKKIALVLSSTEGSIRKTKSLAYKKIKSFLNKTTATWQKISVNEDDDIKTCYEKIYMIRKFAMTKLRIKSDFLEETENSKKNEAIIVYI
jgi:hypothetical protein